MSGSVKRHIQETVDEIRSCKQRLKQLRAEVEALEMCEELSSGTLDLSDEEGSDGELNWDEEDSVWRCRICSWEVAEGACTSCGNAIKDLHNAVDNASWTDTDALHSDRVLAPRGSTPLRDVASGTQPHPDYADRYHEYHTLLQRGATALMCETFQLEFSDAHGIVAWADEAIFQDFCIPEMKDGDNWKIYLGRKVKLEEDDHDGSSFIEGMLEDVLLFPTPAIAKAWETVQESPGVWATRCVDPDALGVDVHVSFADNEDSMFGETEDFSEDNYEDASSQSEDLAGLRLSLGRPALNIVNQYETDSDEELDDVEMADGSYSEAGQENDNELAQIEANSSGVDASGRSDDSDSDQDELFSGDEEVVGTSGPSRSPGIYSIPTSKS